MNSTLRSLIDEPTVADPPPPGRLDAALVVCVLIGLSLETVLRAEIVFKPVALIMFAALSYLLLIRRSRPLLAVGMVFATIVLLDVTALIAGRDQVEVYSAVFCLVLVYSVFRWGSGKQALIAAGIMAVTIVVVQLLNYNGLEDLVGGTLVLYFPAAVAVALRYRRSLREENVKRIKLHEREQLARDLHDTVAHHVSAIAIQAQAGQVLAASSPDEAAKALAVIEEEASRTLAEMRSIVRALRDDDGADHAPQQGVADIASLATAAGAHGPVIDVSLEGDVHALTPSLDAAIYRMAQESITNALRHAVHATSVRVRVNGSANHITLSIVDDGSGVGVTNGRRGWGIIGMTERAELLGGTLQAGPRPPHGWQVRAVLPRNASRQSDSFQSDSLRSGFRQSGQA